MRVHILENPAAGRGHGRRFVRATAAALEDAGHDVTQVYGSKPGDLADHVRSLGVDDVDRLWIAGGDGTLRTIVNARSAPPPWPLGMLPVGTANVVAREIGVHPSYSSQRVAEAVLASEPWPVDLLEVRRDDRHLEWAVLAVSVGFDAEVVHAVGRARRQRAASSPSSTGGYWQWVGHVVSALGSSALAPFSVALDQRPAQEYSLLIVQNARSYGGLFTLSKSASLDSGCLDAVGIRARSVRDIVRVLASVSLQRAERDKQVSIANGGRIAVSAPTKVAVQADGDPCGFSDVEIVLHPGALTLLRSPRAPSLQNRS